MVIRTLTPEAIWSYQAYSTTTCSSLFMNSIHSWTYSPLAFFFFYLAQTAERGFHTPNDVICLGKNTTFFCLGVCPPTNATPTIFSDLPFTIPPVYWAVRERRSFPFWTAYFSSDWTNVWFPNSHTLGDLGENSHCEGNCKVASLKDLDWWTWTFVRHYSRDICLLREGERDVFLFLWQWISDKV